METYHIGFYTSDGKDRIKGNWKTSVEDVDTEANSYLYKNKLGYTLTDKGSITKDKVEAIALEHKMTIGEVLSCI